MKLVIDMNLSPEWVNVLKEEKWDVLHWSDVGKPTAEDHEIMQWAKQHRYVVFTHDLDFGAIVATTRTLSPSVFQLRIQDVNPHHIKNLVCHALKEFQKFLEQGALVTIDKTKSRVRILPF